MTLCWDFSTGSDRHSPVKRSWWSLRSWWLWSSSVGNVARCWAFLYGGFFMGWILFWFCLPRWSFEILWDPLRSLRFFRSFLPFEIGLFFGDFFLGVGEYFEFFWDPEHFQDRSFHLDWNFFFGQSVVGFFGTSRNWDAPRSFHSLSYRKCWNPSRFQHAEEIDPASRILFRLTRILWLLRLMILTFEHW